MTKIGTAHIELKPVLNDASLDEICKVIEERVAAAVQAGIKRGIEQDFDHVRWTMKPATMKLYTDGGAL